MIDIKLHKVTTIQCIAGFVKYIDAICIIMIAQKGKSENIVKLE